MGDYRVVIRALSRAFEYDALRSAFMSGPRVVVTDWEINQFQNNPQALVQLALSNEGGDDG